MTLPQQLASLIKRAKEKLGAGHAAALETEAKKQPSTQKQIEHIAGRIGVPVPAARKTKWQGASKTAAESTPGETDRLRAELQKAQGNIIAGAGKLTAASRRIAELEGELKAATEDTEKQIARRAMTITASQGNVPPFAAKSNPNPATGNNASEALWAAYRALPVSERNAFYKRNRGAMKEE